MAERIYDLNDRGGCATAVIKVADKEFRVNRVVTGVRVLYSNLLKSMAGYLKETAEVDTGDERKMRELTERIGRFEADKRGIYGECLRLLLVRNGYTYDSDWWKDNTDEMDVRRFIEASLSKDSPDVKKK